jgi:hypothetical protein
VDKPTTASLARMMDAGGVEFEESELDRMLAHQLAAPLQLDMELASGALSQKLDAYRASGGSVPARFGDLLFAQNPPVELLDLVKQFAKANKAHPSAALRKIATVVYYASIVAAWLRCGRRISALDDHALAGGCRWVLEQSWIDPKTAALFGQGTKLLQP